MKISPKNVTDNLINGTVQYENCDVQELLLNLRNLSITFYCNFYHHCKLVEGLNDADFMHKFVK